MSRLRVLARLAENEFHLLHRFHARIGALLDTKQEILLSCCPSGRFGPINGKAYLLGSGSA